MNFVGHIHVAGQWFERDRRTHVEPSSIEFEFEFERLLLGSALPDFAAIGRFRLEADSTDNAVASGIDFHHATDTAFHGNEWFVAHSQAVRTDLERRGVNRGAARACGHVGVELLLDGHLLAENPGLRPLAQRTIGLAGDQRLGLPGLVANQRRTAWTNHLDRVSTWRLPDDYDHPMAVASRLERILRSRRRLALEPGDVTVVADVLDDHLGGLVPGIPGLIDALTGELAGHRTRLE